MIEKSFDQAIFIEESPWETLVLFQDPLKIWKKNKLKNSAHQSKPIRSSVLNRIDQ